MGRSQARRERVVEVTQDVNNNNQDEGNANHEISSTDDIEIGQQNNDNVQSNNNVEQQSNNNIEQQQQHQIEEEQPQSIAISNMDQIGVAERRQSRRRSTQETDGTPVAIPVDSVHSSSRRSRQRVPIFNATRIDTSSNDDGEEDILVANGRKRKRQVCMVCFLIVIIGGLSVILGVLLSPSNDNGEKKDTSDEIRLRYYQCRYRQQLSLLLSRLRRQLHNLLFNLQ